MSNLRQKWLNNRKWMTDIIRAETYPAAMGHTIRHSEECLISAKTKINPWWPTQSPFSSPGGVHRTKRTKAQKSHSRKRGLNWLINPSRWLPSASCQRSGPSSKAWLSIESPKTAQHVSRWMSTKHRWNCSLLSGSNKASRRVQVEDMAKQFLYQNSMEQGCECCMINKLLWRVLYGDCPRAFTRAQQKQQEKLICWASSLKSSMIAGIPLQYTTPCKVLKYCILLVYATYTVSTGHFRHIHLNISRSPF